MTYQAVLKEIDGKPARFIGSATGKEDADKVLLRVGDRERTVNGQKWALAPAWSGDWPEWAARKSSRREWLRSKMATAPHQSF